MKTEDRYLKFVRWSEDDKAYVGYCPDLFPWGGVCHGEHEEETYRELCDLVAESRDKDINSTNSPRILGAFNQLVLIREIGVQ